MKKVGICSLYAVRIPAFFICVLQLTNRPMGFFVSVAGTLYQSHLNPRW